MIVHSANLKTPIWIYDIDNARVFWANDSALKLWHSPSLDELKSRDFSEGASHAVTQRIKQYQEGFKQDRVYYETWQFSPNGIDTKALCVFSGYILPGGRMAMLVEATPSSDFSGSVQASTNLLATYDIDGSFISGNPAFMKAFGKTECNLRDIFQNEHEYNKVKDALLDDAQYECDALLLTHNGKHWFHLNGELVTDINNSRQLLLNLYDVDARKKVEQQLKNQALTDPLTSLLNRRGFLTALSKHINNAQAFSLFYIDIDGFKRVNDSLGHSVGDKVLIEVAERLNEHSYHFENIGRFGGDEFLIIVPIITSEVEPLSIARTLIRKLSKSYKHIQDTPLLVSASIGIASFPKDSLNSDDLISFADAAMYHAKLAGKNRLQVYEQGLELAFRRVSDISRYLSVAIRNNELSLHYQPIVDSYSKQIVSIEALLRWHNPELGLIPPDETIKVAEGTGLITEIEHWVLNQAMKDLPKLRKVLNCQATMSINISGMHMGQSNFVENLFMIIRYNNLQPEDIAIELTEGVLLEDIESEQSPVKQMTELGVALHIDDFGTGYSSLAYLHQIPASVVKVDKSFLGTDSDVSTTLEVINQLLLKLNMKSAIEGVETKEQCLAMQSLGFSFQQGYYHSRPQPLAYFLKSDLQIKS